MSRANLEQLTARWSTQHAKDVVLVMIRRDVVSNGGQGLGSVIRSLKFPHAEEVQNARDLRCVTLEGEELSGANLSRAELSWASLAETNLKGANLSNSNLSRACLAGANLAGANLTGADCRRADFTRANLADADFTGAQLDGAVFEEAYSSRAIYKNVVATRVNLRGANLDGVDFEGSDLSRSNLSYGGLDAVAKPPAASADLVYDMARDGFEGKVGLKSEPTRASKRLRPLRPQLRKNAQDDHDARGRPSKSPPARGLHAPRTQILEPIPDAAETEKQPPPSTQVLNRGGPPVLPPRPIRATGKMRRPTDVPNSTRRAPRPPLPVRPPRPATAVTPRRVAGQAPPPIAAAPGDEPNTPTFAPLAEYAQPAHPEWAAAIGELMRLKPSVTRIAIELGDSSRLLYDGTADAPSD